MFNLALIRRMVLLASVAVVAAASTVCAADVANRVGAVVPIDWSRFRTYDQISPKGQDLTDCAKVLLNSARYNFAWAPRATEGIEKGIDVFGRPAHDTIRPACGAAFALAVALKTGMFDEGAVGCSREEAMARTLRLVKATADTHEGKWWGFPWQSAYWTSKLAQAAWLLWDDLDPKTRATVAALLEAEANRFIGYEVPYWNGRGRDTKAEENAWNSTVLSVAVAMMPKHSNVRQWKEKCSELMVSAYATPRDRRSETLIDGRPVKDWIKGFNANDDGTVVNHGFLHPDYMCCVHLNMLAYAVQPLAGQTVPEAADFNASLVYRCFVTKRWPSPPYAEPGGPIYVPGRATVYYPQKADWGRHHYYSYYLLDTQVHLLGLDKGLPHRAQDWMRVRAKGLLAMQSRHADLRIFAPGEMDTCPGREQTSANAIANTFLLLWLDAQKIPFKTGNWLAEGR